MRSKDICEGQYTLYENGDIVKNKTKRKINISRATESTKYARVYIGGKTVVLSRLVYETFSDKKLGNKEKIGFKDGNINNCSYNNLYIMPVRKKTTKLDEKEVIEIKQHYFTDNQKMPYQMIADLYNVSIATISRIINDNYLRKEKVLENDT